MTAPPQLRVLFFDTFGTTVAQRKPIADELWNAAQEALKSNSSLSSEVRANAEKMTYEEYFDLGGEWNTDEDDYVRECKEKQGNVDWRAVDKHRIEALPKLLARRGLVILTENTASSDSGLQVDEGSLFTPSQLAHLGRVWHRLTPWPDSNRGLTLLNTKFTTVALSNTYNELLRSLVSHSSIPFTHNYSSDMFHSYKPNPKVYLGAAEKLSVKPEECALVAAHLGDLKAAKACGFYAIYVERELEEKGPELKKENIPDMVIKESENGFIALAERLGIQVE